MCVIIAYTNPSFQTALLLIYCEMCRRKNFENRYIFDEVARNCLWTNRFIGSPGIRISLRAMQTTFIVICLRAAHEESSKQERGGGNSKTGRVPYNTERVEHQYRKAGCQAKSMTLYNCSNTGADDAQRRKYECIEYRQRIVIPNIDSNIERAWIS